MAANLWVEIVKEGFINPRRSAQRILDLPMTGRDVGQAFAAVAILSMLGTFAMLALGGAGLLLSPLMFTILQGMAMLLFAALIWGVGRIFGGQGDFGGSVRILTWLQALMLVVQLVQLVVLVVLPFLGNIISLLSLILIGYVASGLIAGLHGFRSQPLVVLGMFGALMVIAFGLSLVMMPMLPPL